MPHDPGDKKKIQINRDLLEYLPAWPAVHRNVFCCAKGIGQLLARDGDENIRHLCPISLFSQISMEGVLNGLKSPAQQLSDPHFLILFRSPRFANGYHGLSRRKS